MPLSIARYSFIQLSELEQNTGEKKLAQDVNNAAQDWNPGPLSRESEALPLSHRYGTILSLQFIDFPNFLMCSG